MDDSRPFPSSPRVSFKSQTLIFSCHGTSPSTKSPHPHMPRNHCLPSRRAMSHVSRKLSSAPTVASHLAGLQLAALRSGPFSLVSLTDAWPPAFSLSLNNSKHPARSRELSTPELSCTTVPAPKSFQEGAPGLQPFRSASLAYSFIGSNNVFHFPQISILSQAF